MVGAGCGHTIFAGLLGVFSIIMVEAGLGYMVVVFSIFFVAMVGFGTGCFLSVIFAGLLGVFGIIMVEAGLGV